MGQLFRRLVSCRARLDIAPREIQEHALDKLHFLAHADAITLEDDFRFLSRLENRLRIESDQPAWALPTSPAALRPLARRMGFEGSDAAARLLAELETRRNRIRQIFERYFGAELAD